MAKIPFQIEIIGFVAAILTTASFVPQVYKIWKTKSAQGVSLSMFLIFFTGVSLWFVYGVLLGSCSMIIANTITGILALMIIYFKFKYK
jgi:MtN3 and saliva related transmembrane protein